MNKYSTPQELATCMRMKAEGAAYQVMIERHTLILDERLAALKTLIAGINVEGEDARNQAELFASMLEAMRAVQRFHEEILAQN